MNESRITRDPYHVHQMLISIIPHILMTPDEHGEVAQLTYELLQASQQIVVRNSEE